MRSDFRCTLAGERGCRFKWRPTYWQWDRETGVNWSVIFDLRRDDVSCLTITFMMIGQRPSVTSVVRGYMFSLINLPCGINHQLVQRNQQSQILQYYEFSIKSYPLFKWYICWTVYGLRFACVPNNTKAFSFELHPGLGSHRNEFNTGCNQTNGKLTWKLWTPAIVCLLNWFALTEWIREAKLV